MNSEIFDTHLHMWDLEKVAYSWLKEDTSILNRTYLPDELGSQLLGAGVSKAILVQADNHLEDSFRMLEAAAEYDFIDGVVAWLPLENPSLCDTILKTNYLPNPYFKGVRHLAHMEADPAWLLRPAVMESLQLMAAQKVPYDFVGTSFLHLQTAIYLAHKIPGLNIVLDHLNQPPMTDPRAFEVWKGQMKIASGLPNIYAKISGLGTATGNFTGWTKADIRPAIELVLDNFGSLRCFCGGDWPIALLAGEYIPTWQKYREAIEGLTGVQDQRNIFFENARRFYNT